MIWPGLLAARAMSLATPWTGRLAPLFPSFCISAWAMARGQERGGLCCRGAGGGGGQTHPVLSWLLPSRTLHLSALRIWLFGIGITSYVKKIKNNRGHPGSPEFFFFQLCVPTGRLWPHSWGFSLRGSHLLPSCP